MWNLIIGSVLISAFHGLLPNHWLPIVTVGKERKWSQKKVLGVTSLAALAHAGSTIILGLIIAFLGQQLADSIEYFTHLIAPSILVLIGVWFIIQHYRHHHFHLHEQQILQDEKSERGLILALTGAMFFSPCLEIEAIFLQAGSLGWNIVLIIAILYLVLSLAGMLTWVYLSLKGLEKLNWHKIEHYSGIISGLVLIFLGIIFYFIH